MIEDTSNNIPQLPGQPERAPEFLKDDQWFDVDISADLLDFSEPYRPPRYTMERGGVPFADVGDLHIITGKPGHGKTGLISQLMATVLCGRFGNTTGRAVPRLVRDEATGEVKEQMVHTCVLYIDTEQGKDDTIAIKNRVCTLAGLPTDKPMREFVILRLRDTEEATDRWRKILKAIYLLHPTDIFLDGMLDIVRDYNDQVECQPVVRKCMKVATEYDTSLWAVLHENPMVDKLVGTLGSIVQRKVSEIFAVRKVKQADLKPADKNSSLPDIYFTVKQLKARGRDVKDWMFEYVTGAGGWGVPVEIEDNGQRIADPEAEKRQEAFDTLKTFNWTSAGATFTDLDRHIANTRGFTSNRRRQNLIDTAREAGFLTREGKKYYFHAEKNPGADQQDLPFKKSTDDVPY